MQMLSVTSDKGWQPIDWNAPMDPEAYLAITPPGLGVRGMFFQDLYKLLGESPPTRIIAFKSYPLEDWMRLMLRAAQKLYPDQSLREGLRRLGYKGFESFARSSLGKVYFAFSRDFASAARSVSRAFELVQSYGKFTTTMLDERNVVISMREVWDFCDSNYVGILEATGVTGDYPFDVLVRPGVSLDCIEVKLIRKN